jgi:hypothetical protein
VPAPPRHPKPVQRWIRQRRAFTVWRYAQSYVGQLTDGDAFREARTYCLFLGHARSGHSIVGALLDAHPRIVLADEFDALEYLDKHFSKAQILYLSSKIARDQARRNRVKRGRAGSTYSYLVPGQWQGRSPGATVVGASHAGESVRRLDGDPTLLGRFEQRMRPMDVRFVHVVRNPYDNLATMMLRRGRSFDNAFEHYFSNWDSLVRLRATLDPSRVATLRHEDLLEAPQDALTRLCEFLGVPAPSDYLEACAGILYRKPSRSRDSIEWTPERRRRVEEKVEQIELLRGYSLEG